MPKPVSYPRSKRFSFDNFQYDENYQKTANSLYAVPLSEFSDFVNGKADVEMLAAKQAAFAVTTEVTKKGQDPYEVA
ncbi:type III-A CRISPR-associated RAMP protein Csm4, partial [Lactobacillus delbrueckii subsp. bulgaricus]